MNEAETRAEYIDPALAACGWGVVEGSRIGREYIITPGRLEGRGRRGKGLTADYVLIYRNTKLAVVEAKAWDVPLTEGVGQAKNYAKKLEIRYAYATNGQGIYGIDMKTGTECEMPQYPTPDQLWGMTFAEANAWCDRFTAIPFEDKGGSHPSRYYQDIAVEKVLEAVATDRQRILLTLATGTGKTFIAFQIVWKLFHSRWNLSREPSRRPRILFLADRNILANQAFNAFSAFPEDALVRIDPESIRKKGKVPKNGSIFFTIFQTFMASAGSATESVPELVEGYFGDYPPDFFDFIVIDECHRGGANDESNWRAILDYFAPAVQLGLTATPKRKDNVDTYAYFGEPVYIYSLKDGINDGFLTPFEFKQIIGRGTRLFDGKDYFTVYDFVKAHLHFGDPEWDGEPVADEEPCKKCGMQPCECEVVPPQPCSVCGKRPCECPKEPCVVCGRIDCSCEKKKKAKVKLADGKARTIQHMMMTTFWHPDGTPMSSLQFMEMLFGKLPEFFKDEAELRSLWCEPATRKKLLEGLTEKGFGREQLTEMQRMIDAEKSDLFDVLAHVAYALSPLSREERAAMARIQIMTHFNDKQQAFLDFVLAHYVSVGVEELDQEKLTPLLRLKYDSISDAIADLGGRADEIGKVFAGFQKYLYERRTIA